MQFHLLTTLPIDQQLNNWFAYPPHLMRAEGHRMATYPGKRKTASRSERPVFA